MLNLASLLPKNCIINTNLVIDLNFLISEGSLWKTMSSLYGVLGLGFGV